MVRLARQHNAYSAKESWVGSLSSNNPEQVVDTHMPLSPSSIFGTGQGVATLCSWEGNCRSAS